MPSRDLLTLTVIETTIGEHFCIFGWIGSSVGHVHCHELLIPSLKLSQKPRLYVPTLSSPPLFLYFSNTYSPIHISSPVSPTHSIPLSILHITTACSTPMLSRTLTSQSNYPFSFLTSFAGNLPLVAKKSAFSPASAEEIDMKYKNTSTRVYLIMRRSTTTV